MVSLRGGIGQVVEVTEVDACVKTHLASLWEGSLNVLPSGEKGWYRKLESADRVGHVASAQGLLAFASAGIQIVEIADVTKSLVGRQHNDGSWPFVSNLGDRGVVDSTSWVILSLHACNDGSNDIVIAKGVEWLKKNALPNGGWGICAGARFRVYSTAVALRALFSVKAAGDDIVTSAIQKLLSVSDPATGAWSDASGRLSVAVTGQVLLALHAAENTETYANYVQKATKWLIYVGHSGGWTQGPYVGTHEEVEVASDDGHLVRVEYKHFSAAIALLALMRVDSALRPQVVNGVAQLLSLSRREREGAVADETLTLRLSWVLHDAMVVLAEFRSCLPPSTALVWFGASRVVVHQTDENTVFKLFKRYYPMLIIAAILAVCLFLLSRWSGITGNNGLVGLASFASAVVASLLANLLYGVLASRHQYS